MKNRPFRQRLGFALEGILEVWKLEHSFRSQTVLAVFAILVTVVLHPSFLWAALVVLSIALVLALEMINASIEALIDHVHPDIAPQIKLAKDVAAGAVLIASLGSLAIGVPMILDAVSR